MVKETWSDKWELLTLSHQRAKFDASRSCGTGDILFLVCHVISPNDQRDMWLVKRLSWTLSHYCAKFDVYRSCGGWDVTFLFCRVTSSDYMIKRTCDLVSESPSTLVTIVQSSMFAGLVAVKISRYCFDDITISRDQRDIKLGSWEPLILSHHPSA